MPLVQDEEKEKKMPLLRYYKVFNVSQCRDLPENLVEPLVTKEHDPILECDAIINSMPQCPAIKHEEWKIRRP